MEVGITTIGAGVTVVVINSVFVTCGPITVTYCVNVIGTGVYVLMTVVVVVVVVVMVTVTVSVGRAPACAVTGDGLVVAYGSNAGLTEFWGTGIVVIVCGSVGGTVECGMFLAVTVAVDVRDMTRVVV